MGFRVNCDIDYEDDKGKKVKCRNEMEPSLGKDGLLYCECGKKMKNQDCLSPFAKRQMVTLGQTKRNEKSRQAFSVKCGACGKDSKPKLKNNKVFCTACEKELNVTGPMLQVLKMNIKAAK